MPWIISPECVLIPILIADMNRGCIHILTLVDDAWHVAALVSHSQRVYKFV